MDDVRPLKTGSVFGDRYRILAPLGTGGMGHVYRAEHVALGKLVALKVMRGATRVDHLETRFEREAHAIARLDHASCVRVIDYGRSETHGQYIAMELLEGTTLAELIEREGPFSVTRALGVVRHLLGALGHAHAHGILHRDVKPENVVVTTTGRAVLIDFGLACLHDAPSLTATGTCLGSPSYLAPERLQGHAHSARSDLYAAGVILYELLAGMKPFVGPSIEDIMQAAMHRPPRPLRALRADVSAALEAVIWRALAKDPARRFADADEMLSALDALPAEELAPAVLPARVTDEDPGTAQTMAIEDLVRPRWWSRLWSRVRYGRWKWHEPSGAH